MKQTQDRTRSTGDGAEASECLSGWLRPRGPPLHRGAPTVKAPRFRTARSVPEGLARVHGLCRVLALTGDGGRWGSPPGLGLCVSCSRPWPTRGRAVFSEHSTGAALMGSLGGETLRHEGGAIYFRCRSCVTPPGWRPGSQVQACRAGRSGLRPRSPPVRPWLCPGRGAPRPVAHPL